MLSHKEASPLDTVQKIRSLLEPIGIFPYEKEWFSFEDLCYSVRLEFKNYPEGVNGKGPTKDLALASAYGEMMERVQNRMLFQNTFGLMPEKDPPYLDLKRLTWQDENSAFPTGRVVDCAPYYNVFKEQVSYFPYHFMKRVCASNGMCAGNTPAEAIVQGISEIFERYVWKKIYTDSTLTQLPTIPLDLISDPYSLSVIEALQRRGDRVLIKDCTLDGRFPVIGVVIMSANGRYALRLGADPVLAIALQRCFTEIFQGVTDTEQFDNITTAVDFGTDTKLSETQYAHLMASAKPMPHTNAWFFSTQSPHYVPAFLPKWHSNEHALQFMVGRVREMGYDLFIRDVSYLQFPSYHVYIPTLSEMQPITPQLLKLLDSEPQIKKCLLRLKSVREADLKTCARLLDQSFSYLPPLTFGSIDLGVFDRQSDIFKLSSPPILLAMLFHRCGQHKKALRYLKLVNENHPYYLASMAYFKLKIDDLDDYQIAQNLTDIFGEEIANPVIGDLCLSEYCFDNLKLPECGNCTQCPIQKDCYYEKWQELNLKFSEQMAKHPIYSTRFQLCGWK